MNRLQPQIKFEFAERAATRYRDDVALWKADHDALANDPWPLQELLEIANRAFERFATLDAEIRRSSRAGEMTEEDYDRLDSKIGTFFERWLATSKLLEPDVERLQGAYESIEGGAAFLAHVREAKAMMAADEEFFDLEEITRLRVAALAAHKRGDVEPLLDDDPPQ